MNAFKVINFILQETGSYNDIHYRPYVSNIDGTAMDDMVNRINDFGDSSSTDNIFSGMVSNIVAPSALPGKVVNIPLGWEERRVRFVLIISSKSVSGSEYLYYLQGFTSHLGITNSGAVDPEMEFFINSFIRVTRSSMYGPNGLEVLDKITESSHVINGDIIHDFVDDELFCLRPQDVYTGIQSAYLEQVNTDYGYNNNFTDTRLLIDEPVKSNRRNSVPSNYLTDIIRGYKSGLSMSDYSNSESDILDQCRQITKETGLVENPVLRAIANIRGFGNGSTFNYSDIEALDPGVSSVTNFMTVGNANPLIHSAGQTAYWDSATIDTQAATVLGNAVPALMLDSLICKLHFRATNLDVGSEISLVFINAESITNTSVNRYLEALKYRIISSVLLEISFNNNEPFTVDMSCDLFGETRLTIAIANEPPIDYAVPTFCDSLMVPIVSNVKDSVYNMSHGFESVINQVGAIARTVENTI